MPSSRDQGTSARTCHLTLAHFWSRNMLIVSSMIRAASQYPTTAAETRSARSTGARAGLLVAAGFVGIGAVGFLPGVLSSPEDVPSQVTIAAILAIPTFLAGWFGGRALGPRAMRAQSRRDWASVIVRL